MQTAISSCSSDAALPLQAVLLVVIGIGITVAILNAHEKGCQCLLIHAEALYQPMLLQQHKPDMQSLLSMNLRAMQGLCLYIVQAAIH